MIKRSFAILALSTAFVSGCGDTPAPTQPDFRQRTPTPSPGRGVSISVTLSRLDPPSDARHAVGANFVVRETLGRAWMLTRVVADPYIYDTAQIRTSGFTPLRLNPGESASFGVTLTSNDDISCEEGLRLLVFIQGDAGAEYFESVRFGCTTDGWPF